MDDSGHLFEGPLFPQTPEQEKKGKPRTYKRVSTAIWTEHKAKFIQQYLKTFVFITKTGIYIDGFAGPQYFDQTDSWAAKLVLESEPKWIKQFYFCELKERGRQALEDLAVEQEPPCDRKGRKPRRIIEIWPGDFNVNVAKILAHGLIKQTDPTFCLLDQRTFECHWSTLETLAKFKEPPNRKVELLYFLGVGWIHRAFSGIRRQELLQKWWGRDDYSRLKAMSVFDIVELVRSRFTTELGYKHVAGYPIFDSAKSNRVMYYMMHASDHDEAPALMVRAHGKAVRSLPAVQRKMFPE